MNDQMMQTIAQNGNGTAAYIDTLAEAEKVLVEDASSTLFTIAKDVKIQVEFNPNRVSEYRLIGYETRALNREDFNNDRVDAGDIGSGHSVTAIYEITPKGSGGEQIDPLRYGEATVNNGGVANADEYAFVKIRYKLPNEDVSKLITTPVTSANEVASLTRPAPTSASPSLSQPSARSCATRMRPRSSVTTRSWRLPPPPEEPTRLGTGRNSCRLCALPRRWAVTGSGNEGRFHSDEIVLIGGAGLRAGEAGRRGFFPCRPFFDWRCRQSLNCAAFPEQDRNSLLLCRANVRACGGRNC
ncbi:hypothetical protein AJ88_18380 [Mesorhizobium amorphae CCBAU 01583]|nr:hypothetical protein AJ88_18380 [Mesorhizobium amorphae CCBAU 01583]